MATNIRTITTKPHHHRKKHKIHKKEIITEDVSLNHLLRSLPFHSKDALCSIRKNAIFQTLKNHKCNVKKSYSLVRLIDIAKDYFSYEPAIAKIQSCMMTLQKKYRKYLANIELRLQGPGIPVALCVNEECPYTMEPLNEIEPKDVITWRDSRKIYGCDFQAFYPMFIKTLENEDTLYTHRMDFYIERIQTYDGLTDAQKSRSSRRNAFHELSNPFTRNPFPAEFFERVIHIAKNKNLLRDSPRRIRGYRNIREPVFEDNEQNNQINSQNIIQLSNEVSESLRRLEFYTPESVLSEIITPLTLFLDETQTNSVPLQIALAQSVRLFEYIAAHCIPIFENLSIHFTSPLVRNNAPRHSHQFIGQFTRNVQSQLLYERCNTVERYLNDARRHIRVIEQVQRLSRMYLETWTQLMTIFNEMLSTNHRVISQEDKKGISIILIIALANTNHLPAEFNWLRTLD